MFPQDFHTKAYHARPLAATPNRTSTQQLLKSARPLSGLTISTIRLHSHLRSPPVALPLINVPKRRLLITSPDQSSNIKRIER